jgi:hypothetical protein
MTRCLPLAASPRASVGRQMTHYIARTPKAAHLNIYDVHIT